jgi:hypothetical protein
MRKLSGYILHLHLATEGENFERSVVTVKLLRYSWVLLENHAQLGDANTACAWENQLTGSSDQTQPIRTQLHKLLIECF